MLCGYRPRMRPVVPSRLATGHSLASTTAGPSGTGRVVARVLLALALGLTLIATWAPGAGAEGGRTVTVMTQNLYQGTEFAHIQGLVGASPSFEEALAATTTDYATYEATRFNDRAKLIAAEIAQNRPALVGLQEVATWHRGAFDPTGPWAETVAKTMPSDRMTRDSADHGLGCSGQRISGWRRYRGCTSGATLWCEGRELLAQRVERFDRVRHHHGPSVCPGGRRVADAERH